MQQRTVKELQTTTVMSAAAAGHHHLNMITATVAAAHLPGGLFF
jgi:hypothetical protein